METLNGLEQEALELENSLEQYRGLMIDQLKKHQPLSTYLKDMLGVKNYEELDTKILAGMIFGGVDRKIVDEYDQRKANLPDNVASMLKAVVNWKARREEASYRRTR